MVHDQSKAGSTYFIEPVSVVRLNNEIRELQLAESKEIARILATLFFASETFLGSFATERVNEKSVKKIERVIFFIIGNTFVL